MPSRWGFRWCGAAVAALALSVGGVTHAAVVTVDAADYLGSRTEAAGELVTLDNWIDDGITFSWDITFDGTNYTYHWTIDGWSGPANGLSHIDFAASDGRPGTEEFTNDDILAGSSGGITDVGNLNSGKFGAPTDMYGVRFGTSVDTPPLTFTIVTDRAPIWGSFAAKAAADSGAYNVGWSNWKAYLADTSIEKFVFDETEWVPVPDSVGGPVVPEPASIITAGIGGLVLAGLTWTRRRKRR